MMMADMAYIEGAMADSYSFSGTCIIAGGNIKIIFTDSLFVCVGNDDMLINKKRSKSIAPFFYCMSAFYLFFKTNFLNSPG